MTQDIQDANLKQSLVRHANLGTNKNLMYIMTLWQNLTLMEVTITVETRMVQKSLYGAILLIQRLHLNFVILFHLRPSMTLMTLQLQSKNVFQEEH